jgi:uncharacterized OsmC-like protein
MSTLREYLKQKREALLLRRQQVLASGDALKTLKASARAEGRSGVRRIKIRDFQVISDSEADFAGYDLGPSSPELQLGALASCLTHIYLIQAAEQQIPLDSLEVEITGQLDLRGGRPGFEHIPVYPHKLEYTVHIDSPSTPEQIEALTKEVERVCPVLNLLRNPQEIEGTVKHISTGATVLAV